MLKRELADGAGTVGLTVLAGEVAAHAGIEFRADHDARSQIPEHVGAAEERIFVFVRRAGRVWQITHLACCDRHEYVGPEVVLYASEPPEGARSIQTVRVVVVRHEVVVAAAQFGVICADATAVVYRGVGGERTCRMGHGTQVQPAAERVVVCAGLEIAVGEVWPKSPSSRPPSRRRPQCRLSDWV